jgi:hypothetical protein
VGWCTAVRQASPAFLPGQAASTDTPYACSAWNGTMAWPHPSSGPRTKSESAHTRIAGKGIDRSVHGGLEQGVVMISRPRNPPCSLRRAGALSWRPWPISRASTACRRDVREFAELEVWALEASAEVREQRQRYVPLESHPEKRTPGSRLVSSHCFNIFFQLFYLFFFSFSSEFLKFILYKICPRNFFTDTCVSPELASDKNLLFAS